MRDSTVPTRLRVVLVLSVVLAVLSVFDLVLHVAIDQVEPLRVSGNVVVLIAALALLSVPSARRAWFPAAAGAVSLGLNLVFITLDGIGPLGALLVVASTALCAAVAVILAGIDRRSPQ